jgi:acyl phosphate:glycerol-3-phosphate acyltransferase
MPTDAVLVVLAYLVGTFPTAILVGRRTGHDPTQEGSGNPGASNVYRTSGRRAGVIVALGDIAKGVLPAAVGLAAGGRGLGIACWVAATLGHVVPVTRRFRGGKGVATAAGGALVLFPLAAAVLSLVFVVLMRTLRIASIGSIVIAVGLPVLVALTGHPAAEVLASASVSALVVVRHHRNVRRLLAGEEHRIGG